MAGTRAELVARSCARLGEAGINGDLSPEMRSKVDGGVPGVLADLRHRGVADLVFPLGDAEHQHVSAILADAMADEAGVVGEDRAALNNRAQDAEAKLRRIFYRPAGSRPLRVSYL